MEPGPRQASFTTESNTASMMLGTPRCVRRKHLRSAGCAHRLLVIVAQSPPHVHLETHACLAARVLGPPQAPRHEQEGLFGQKLRLHGQIATATTTHSKAAVSPNRLGGKLLIARLEEIQFAMDV